MFFSVFNYYKKRTKKITLKKSATKNIVKNMKDNALLFITLCKNMQNELTRDPGAPFPLCLFASI